MTGVPAAADADLGATYGANAAGGQYHVNPRNELWYFALNTERAPSTTSICGKQSTMRPTGLR